MVLSRSPLPMGRVRRAASALGLDAVDLDRILDEQDVETPQGLDDRHGLQGCEPAVKLENDVGVRPHRIACRFNPRANLARQRIEAQIAAIAGNRVELDSGETFADGKSALLGKHIGAEVAENQLVQANAVATTAAQKLVDRYAESLSLDVPEGNIDGGHGAAGDRAAERPHAVELVPVVFDAASIFTDKILCEAWNDRIHCLWIGPAARLAESGEARLGGNLDEMGAPEQARSDLGDPHGAHPLLRSARDIEPPIDVHGFRRDEAGPG